VIFVFEPRTWTASKLEYYYVLQVYWDFAVIGLANWRQSARGGKKSGAKEERKKRCLSWN
jgi:hypothetical protein